MEISISKTKDVVNGNEAFLLGVDKLGQQVWLEVLNPTQIKCDSIPSENINLNNLLPKKVFDNNDGNYLNGLLTEYVTKINYLKRHPEYKEYANGIEMQKLVKHIINVIKP